MDVNIMLRNNTSFFQLTWLLKGFPFCSVQLKTNVFSNYLYLFKHVCVCEWGGGGGMLEGGGMLK